MTTTTNIDDLILVCIDCGHTEPAPPWFPGSAATGGWARHCASDMRLTNLTDRDGNPAEDHT